MLNKGGVGRRLKQPIELGDHDHRLALSGQGEKSGGGQKSPCVAPRTGFFERLPFCVGVRKNGASRGFTA
jgi:hypothetical protein